MPLRKYQIFALKQVQGAKLGRQIPIYYLIISSRTIKWIDHDYIKVFMDYKL